MPPLARDCGGGVMVGRDDELIRRFMKEIDALDCDAERWHNEADDLLCECLLLDVSQEARQELVEWFRAHEKWYS